MKKNTLELITCYILAILFVLIICVSVAHVWINRINETNKRLEQIRDAYNAPTENEKAAKEYNKNLMNDPL